MAALIMKDVLFSLLYFSLLMKTEQAISETSAATYKVMEPYYCSTVAHQSSHFFKENW